MTSSIAGELQMSAADRRCRDTPTRAVRWVFKTLHSIRHVVLRAGRLTRPEAG